MDAELNSPRRKLQSAARLVAKSERAREKERDKRQIKENYHNYEWPNGIALASQSVSQLVSTSVDVKLVSMTTKERAGRDRTTRWRAKAKRQS